MKDENILAVVQKSDHSIGFYRIDNGEELARAPLDQYPHEFAVSPDGSTFYVSEYGVQSSGSVESGGNQVAIFDVAERRVTKRISCGGLRRPHGIACDRKGVLYVLCEGADSMLVKHRPQEGETFDNVYQTGGKKGHMLAVKSDGSRAFFMNINSHTVTTVNLEEGQDSTPQVVYEGEWPEGFCFNRDESLLFVGNRGANYITVIDTVRLGKIGVIPARPTPLRMTLDCSGRIICVHFGEDRTISVINADSGKEEASFVPPAAAVFAGLDASGNRAVFSLQDDSVQIYDTNSWTCMNTIRTLAEPDVAAFIWR